MTANYFRAFGVLTLILDLPVLIWVLDSLTTDHWPNSVAFTDDCGVRSYRNSRNRAARFAKVGCALFFCAVVFTGRVVRMDQRRAGSIPFKLTVHGLRHFVDAATRRYGLHLATAKVMNSANS